MEQKGNSVLLDVDRSILEQKLLLEDNKEEDLEDLLPFLQSLEQSNTPYKLAQPTPGMCIKTRTTDGDKVFVNLCQTEEIPCPDLLDDEDLLRIWSSDEAGDYRLPMSIGEGHQEADKSGNPAMAYDVAVNPILVKKVESNKLYLKFLITVVLEAIQEKFKLQIDAEDYSILKNRKAMGKLQKHRIKQRPTEDKTKKPLIEDLGSSSHAAVSGDNEQKTITAAKALSSGSHQPMSTAMPEYKKQNTTTATSAPSSGSRQPEYYIWQQPAEGDPEVLVAEMRMGEVLGARELSLDVGEDRIIVESRRHGYLLDVFVPHSINQEKTCAQFDACTRILTVTMPVN